jgi:uncharacterized protein involved in exopolysaccharide biosynthesis
MPAPARPLQSEVRLRRTGSQASGILVLTGTAILAGALVFAAAEVFGERYRSSVVLSVQSGSAAEHAAGLVASERLRAVAERLDLSSHPEFAAPKSSAGTLDWLRAAAWNFLRRASGREAPDVVDLLARNLDIERNEADRSIVLSLTSGDTLLPATVLNALVIAYRQPHLEAARAEAERERDAAIARRQILQREIVDIALELDRTASSPVSGAALDEVADAERRLAEIQSRARIATDLVSRGQQAALPEFRSSLAVQQLTTERDRLVAEKGDLRPSSARARQIDGEIAALERQMREQADAIVAAIDAEAARAAARLEALRRQAAGPAVETAEASAQRAALMEAQRAKTAELEALDRTLEATRSGVQVGASQLPVAVREAAVPASRPIVPAPLTLGAMTVVAVLLVGAAAMALRAELDRRVRRAQARDRQQRPLPSASLSTEAAAERLLVAAAGRPGHRTLVAPADPRASVALEVEALVAALARAGQTVLRIDCTAADRPGAAAGVRAERGLVDVLDTGDFAGAIIADRTTSSHVLAWKGFASPADAAVSSDRLNSTLDALDAIYDHIVFAGEANGTARVFETIEGRVDIALEVGGTVFQVDVPVVRILGYDAVDLTVLPVTPSKAVASGAKSVVRPERRAA